MRHARLLFRCIPFALASSAGAQVGGFVATLGSDTVHVERFERRGGRIEGTIVTRSPKTRVVKYAFTLDAKGMMARYDVATYEGDGTPVRTTGTAGSMVVDGDTITRTTLRNGVEETQRVPAPSGAVPGPTIPYVGVSYLTYELAFAAARARAAAGSTDAFLYQLTMLPTQMAPQRTPAWLVSRDSTELSYFGVAKSGYRFNAAGELTGADWRNTTYRYRVARVANVDVDAIANRWTAADKAGTGMGALSPRDTSRGTVGSAQIAIDYSRPSRRGRIIWGDVVAWNAVWRLGADMATHVTTSTDLRVGGTLVPAGRYTLWMLPSETGETKLIVSSAVNVFGTNYQPARDFARITMERVPSAESVERLTIDVADGYLRVRWGDAMYRVSLSQ